MCVQVGARKLNERKESKFVLNMNGYYLKECD